MKLSRWAAVTLAVIAGVVACRRAPDVARRDETQSASTAASVANVSQPARPRVVHTAPAGAQIDHAAACGVRACFLQRELLHIVDGANPPLTLPLSGKQLAVVSYDSTAVYGSHQTDPPASIWSWPLAGGPARLVAVTEGRLLHITSSAERIFWSEALTVHFWDTDSSRIMEVPRSGGASHEIMRGWWPARFIIDGSDIVGVREKATDLTLFERRGTGAPRAITSVPAADADQLHFAVDSNWIYWADSAGVSRVPRVSGTPRATIAQCASAPKFAVRGESVYMACGKQVLRVGSDGVEKIADANDGVDAIFAAGTGVYWTSANRNTLTVMTEKL